MRRGDGSLAILGLRSGRGPIRPSAPGNLVRYANGSWQAAPTLPARPLPAPLTASTALAGNRLAATPPTTIPVRGPLDASSLDEPRAPEAWRTATPSGRGSLRATAPFSKHREARLRPGLSPSPAGDRRCGAAELSVGRVRGGAEAAEVLVREAKLSGRPKCRLHRRSDARSTHLGILSTSHIRHPPPPGLSGSRRPAGGRSRPKPRRVWSQTPPLSAHRQWLDALCRGPSATRGDSGQPSSAT